MKKILTTFLIVLIAAVSAISQGSIDTLSVILETPPKEGFTSDSVGYLAEIIYGFLVLVFGFLSNRIPLFRDIKKTAIRVASGAIAIAILTLGVTGFNLQNILNLVLTYGATAGIIYDLILKPLNLPDFVKVLLENLLGNKSQTDKS